jgi:TonB family protein
MRRPISIGLCAFCVAFLQIGLGQVQDSISARKIVSRVQPQYPALAHAAHVTGTAKLLVKVNNNGKVESVEVVGGHPLLAQAATIAGQPVEMGVIQPANAGDSCGQVLTAGVSTNEGA